MTELEIQNKERQTRHVEDLPQIIRCKSAITKHIGDSLTKLSRKKIAAAQSMANTINTSQIFSIIETENGVKVELAKGKENLLAQKMTYMKERLKKGRLLETSEPVSIKIFQYAERENTEHFKTDLESYCEILQTFKVLKGKGHRSKTIRLLSTSLVQQKFYAVQKWIPGIDLFHLRKRHISTRSLFIIDFLDIAIDILTDLKVRFHDQNYLHRDIKLENVIHNPELSTTAIFIDYDFVKKMHTGINLFDASHGSPENYAPEMREDSKNRKPIAYSRETDLYAVGKLLRYLFDCVECQHAITQDILSLINGLQAPDLNNRLNAEQALCCLQLIRNEAKTIKPSLNRRR